MTATPAMIRFDVRCEACRRLLGQAEVPREHAACGVTYTTKCRTESCRDRLINVTFEESATSVIHGARSY